MQGNATDRNNVPFARRLQPPPAAAPGTAWRAGKDRRKRAPKDVSLCLLRPPIAGLRFAFCFFSRSCPFLGGGFGSLLFRLLQSLLPLALLAFEIVIRGFCHSVSFRASV